MTKCDQHNCQLEDGHGGWHQMYHYGTQQPVIEWADGVWRTFDGKEGTYNV